jgi:hypothetical protein
LSLDDKRVAREVARRLWDKLILGWSLVNCEVRLSWIKIYRCIYYYFNPFIEILESEKKNEVVHLDPVWY